MPALAQALRLPFRTWQNYEQGVTIPAVVILRLIGVCGASARWLLTGEGPRFMHGDSRPGDAAMVTDAAPALANAPAPCRGR